MTALDDAVDAWFEPLRGDPTADAVAVALSNLSDYGVAWALVAAAKGRRPGTRRRVARSLALAGTTSFAVNAAAKQLVQRGRPEGARGVTGVRTPTSTSFPSGHTLAAFCTALVLADSGGELAAYLVFAGAVAASRVHLRAHHATDVVGGAAIGTVLGLLLRRVGEWGAGARR